MKKPGYVLKNIAIFTLSYLLIITLMLFLYMTGPSNLERIISLATAVAVLTIQSSVLFLLVINYKKRIW